MNEAAADLAIVIPAYRAKYFTESLSSIARQTHRGFRVYVGDDASPDNLREIADRFAGEFSLSYHRFAENLGGRDLVGQWTRCVGLIGNERWIWLFSDDDIATDNCVGEFLAVARKFPSDIYRFNTQVIDAGGRVIHPTMPSPDFERSEEMAYHLLCGGRGNSMPDLAFSRARYEECGGFVSTAFGQGADWATSILFSQRSGMRMIQRATVSWRRSGDNVSSTAAANRRRMVPGHYQFVTWVLRHFEYLKEQRDGRSPTHAEMVEAARYNLATVLVRHFGGLTPGQYREYLRFVRKAFGFSGWRALRELGRVVVRSRRHARG